MAHIDSAYAAYFFGGQGSDYDVYHYASDGFEANSGTMMPWIDMYNVVLSSSWLRCLCSMRNPINCGRYRSSGKSSCGFRD